MRKVFAISDLHLGHQAIVKKMIGPDGEPLRPFNDLDTMHRHIIDRWNAVVGQNDLVLVLGDVAFSNEALHGVMRELAGTKRLVRGNHDTLGENAYRQYFQRVLGAYERDGFIFTHIPIHETSVGRWRANIHGHTHLREPRDVSPKHFNVSVEAIDYTPINLEDLKVKFPLYK